MCFTLHRQEKNCEMGQTNIHRASALLSRAGISFEDQARIEPCGKEIYLNFESLPQEEINKIGPLLNHGSQDTWVSRNITDYRFRPVSAPPPIAYPKVCVSFGLKERLTRDPMSSYSTPRKPDELPNEALGFIIVVQGANASERSKVVTKTTLEAVSKFNFHQMSTGKSCHILDGRGLI